MSDIPGVPLAASVSRITLVDLLSIAVDEGVREEPAYRLLSFLVLIR